ncbi:23S rRNA (adenine(2503)-C(2))-methyltransferase RlmN [Patescibacteria group bacterium]|nr:23S rRNA (adenine(2503)-C(2))-methyltransferase RlmN [Patescibacteria group bacterium]
MPLHNLHQHFIGQVKYRLKQAQRAVYQDLIDNWSKAINFPLELRESLNKDYPLEVKAEFFISKNNKAVKALITLADGQKIETVLLKNSDGRNSLCVSSQVGCQISCRFCATGQMGYKRDLEPDEIINQALVMARYLKSLNVSNHKITNIIFMGMGEPFLNYDNVIWAIKILNDSEGFNLGARHFSISTCGVIPGIQKLAKEKLQINLAISLNAPTNELRSKLMPINKKYSLEKVMATVNDYIKRTGRQVMFEYLLIKGVNDSLFMAKQLSQIINNHLFVVNLIPYNPTGKFKASDKKQIMAFKKVLEDNRVKVTQRNSFGQDIMAACGQLAGRGSRK